MYKSLIQWIFVLLFLFVVTSGISDIQTKTPNRNNKNKPLIKIAIVNSYNPQHICTTPQQNGFSEYFKDYTNLFNFKIKAFYLFAKTKNTTPVKLDAISKKIMQRVEAFAPDIIYTTDDAALHYVGIPLSVRYPVISSGLNKPAEDYIKDFSLCKKKNKIIFIAEYVRLDGVFNLLEQNNVFISNFYLLVENPKTSSMTNFYLYKNYLNELRGKGNIIPYKIRTVVGLRKALIDINKKPVGVIIPIIQRVLDEDGNYRDKMYILKEILKLNKYQLEIAGNLLFCRFGLAICSMPDFFRMGEAGASLVMKYMMKKYKRNENIQFPEWLTVVRIPNKIAVNKKRLEQLHFENLLYNTSVVNKIYDDVLE